MMKITFNINSKRFEEHSFNFLETTLFAAMVIGGISFWVIAAAMLFDPSYYQ